MSALHITTFVVLWNVPKNSNRFFFRLACDFSSVKNGWEKQIKKETFLVNKGAFCQLYDFVSLSVHLRPLLK